MLDCILGFYCNLYVESFMDCILQLNAFYELSSLIFNVTNIYYNLHKLFQLMCVSFFTTELLFLDPLLYVFYYC